MRQGDALLDRLDRDGGVHPVKRESTGSPEPRGAAQTSRSGQDDREGGRAPVLHPAEAWAKRKREVALFQVEVEFHARKAGHAG